MSFLSGIIASLIEWFLEKLFSRVQKEIKQVADDKAIDERTKSEDEALKEAKTAQEVENAARNTLDGI